MKKFNLQIFGIDFPPYYGKSKFYENKKAKALAKIAKLQNVVAECDKHITDENK